MQFIQLTIQNIVRLKRSILHITQLQIEYNVYVYCIAFTIMTHCSEFSICVSTLEETSSHVSTLKT